MITHPAQFGPVDSIASNVRFDPLHAVLILKSEQVPPFEIDFVFVYELSQTGVPMLLTSPARSRQPFPMSSLDVFCDDCTWNDIIVWSIDCALQVDKHIEHVAIRIAFGLLIQNPFR